MEIKFTSFPKDTNWVKGQTDTGYYFSAKLFDVPSMFGINEGRVSKFALSNGDKTIYHWDRGLDFDDIKSKESRQTFKKIIEFCEKAPQRFTS